MSSKLNSTAALPQKPAAQRRHSRPAGQRVEGVGARLVGPPQGRVTGTVRGGEKGRGLGAGHGDQQEEHSPYLRRFQGLHSRKLTK